MPLTSSMDNAEYSLRRIEAPLPCGIVVFFMFFLRHLSHFYIARGLHPGAPFAAAAQSRSGKDRPR